MTQRTVYAELAPGARYGWLIPVVAVLVDLELVLIHAIRGRAMEKSQAKETPSMFAGRDDGSVANGWRVPP